MIGKEPAQDTSKKGAGIDECKKIASEIGRHAMSQAVVRKIKVRRPEAKNDHEHRGHLERIGRISECIQKDEVALPSHTRGTKTDSSNSEQKKAQEAADALSPSEANAGDQIVQDDGIDDAAKGRAGRSECHGHCALFVEVMTNDGESWSKYKTTRHA